jgi:signal transduction histidine kinase
MSQRPEPEDPTPDASASRNGLEREQLLSLVEQLHSSAVQERAAHEGERAGLETVLRRRNAELAQLRAETAAERLLLHDEADRFKRDVDAQLQAATQQRLEGERIIECIPVGIAYLEPGLTFLWANRVFLGLVGRTPAELVGLPLAHAFPAAPPEFVHALRDVIASGATGEAVRLPFVHGLRGADPKLRWDMVALPLKGNGQANDGVLLALDVTARFEAEQAQAVKIAQLTELDRLKGDFISMISHELRTPLTAIAGYAEFLEDDLAGTLTGPQREYVRAIQAAEGRIRAIVEDLLDFARIEAGTFKLSSQPTDLVALTRAEIQLLLPAAAAAQVRLTCEVALPSLMVQADPMRLAQVLLNLVGNAIKFTLAGGAVSVEVGAAGPEARVRVRDTGLGIAPEHLDKVFDRFFQVDAGATRARGGAGLGLAIAKSLVERQGGRMGVESAVGQGTTFWFTLPLLGEPESATSVVA